MHSSDFYVVLPSNSVYSKELFPANEPSSFSIKLSQPVSLLGEWEVGIAEIHLPFTWKNIDNYNQSFEISIFGRAVKTKTPITEDPESKRRKTDSDINEIKKKEKEAAEKKAKEDAAEKKRREEAAEKKKKADADAETKKKAEAEAERKRKEEEEKAKTVIKEPKLTVPPRSALVVIEPKEFRNAKHFFDTINKKLRRKNLSNDFLLKYTGGKNNQPSTLLLGMGNAHRMTIEENNFWTEVLGFDSAKVGPPIVSQNEVFILKPKMLTNIKVDEPGVIIELESSIGKPKQTVTVPSGHYGKIGD